VHYIDAGDVKKKMQEWAGNNPKFYPHAAQYGFEACLIPFWHEIQRIADTAFRSRGASPEKIDHDNLPSHHTLDIPGGVLPWSLR